MRDVLSLSEAQWARCSELFKQLQGLPASVQEARLQEMHAQRHEDPDVLKLVARQLQDQHFLEFERDRTGEWITEKYQLGTQIGSGGMGVVYRATRHLTEDARPSEVAVKLIRPTFLLTEQRAAMERFQRELAILQGLQHPHIAHCYDGGFHTDARSGDKMLFMVTELVREGRPLTRYAQDHELPVQLRLQKFLEVCDAVLAMHTQRPPVIHGDLTPNNILVDQYHRLYVIDFGLAQVCDPTRWRRGEPCIAGTLPYMSPEQVLDGRVTLQSDVYSLGIILYELLAGQRPYEMPPTASAAALRRAIRGAEYHALDQRELDQIVTKVLALDPTQRYASVADLLWDIKTYHEQQRVRPVMSEVVHEVLRQERFEPPLSFNEAPEALTTNSLQDQQRRSPLDAETLIMLPQLPWRPGIMPPGALLRADIEGAVPFHGRRDEIVSIETWCEGAAPIGVRLYTGAGGIGKTRLFIEMCHRLRTRRWRAGFLDDQAAGAPAATWSKLVNHPDPLFLVIDYAETRRAEIAAVLREAFKVGDDRRVRIVLMARAAADWWEQLKTEREGVRELLSGPATQWFSLGPLALTPENRTESYRLALRTFADRLKPEKPPSNDPPEDIGSEIFERILLLHMSAIAAVDGVQVKGDQGILDYVLLRERGFWSKRTEAKDLSQDIVPGIAQAMAVLTLGGGARTRKDAIAVFEQLTLLKDQPATRLNRVSELLHETYPGAKWIEPLLPDLLGEHLVQVEYEKSPDALFDLVFGAREGDADARSEP